MYLHNTKFTYFMAVLPIQRTVPISLATRPRAAGELASYNHGEAKMGVFQSWCSLCSNKLHTE